MTYWKTEEPGYYKVEFEQQNKNWTGGFAVNTAAVESRLEKVPWEGVAGAIEAGSVKLVESARWGENGMGGAGGSRELTPYVALLALALLAAESWLANRFYRGTGEPGEKE